MMGTKDKLIERFKTLPKDFTFDEMVRLLNSLGYTMNNKGKTSGSRVRFVNSTNLTMIDLHKPHPKSIIKETALKEILLMLQRNGLIKK